MELLALLAVFLLAILIGLTGEAVSLFAAGSILGGLGVMAIVGLLVLMLVCTILDCVI